MLYLNKIGSIIKMHANSNALSSEWKQTLDKNKQVKFWVHNILLRSNLIIKSDEIGNSQAYQVNRDEIDEYLDYLENNFESYRQEVAKMDIF